MAIKVSSVPDEATGPTAFVKVFESPVLTAVLESNAQRLAELVNPDGALWAILNDNLSKFAAPPVAIRSMLLEQAKATSAIVEIMKPSSAIANALASHVETFRATSAMTAAALTAVNAAAERLGSAQFFDFSKAMGERAFFPTPFPAAFVTPLCEAQSLEDVHGWIDAAETPEDVVQRASAAVWWALALLVAICGGAAAGAAGAERSTSQVILAIMASVHMFGQAVVRAEEASRSEAARSSSTSS